MKRQFLTAGIWFTVTGALILFAGIRSFIVQRRKIRQWPRAEALVKVAYQKRDRRSNSLIGESRLLISFTDALGRPQETSVAVSDSQMIGSGSSVTVAYNPENPEDAILASGWQIGFGLGLCLVLGVIAFGLGLAYLGKS